ncbi:MAG: hypothetical protein AB1454_01800 [Candidatus Auribacterota bacterium]
MKKLVKIGMAVFFSAILCTASAYSLGMNLMVYNTYELYMDDTLTTEVPAGARLEIISAGANGIIDEMNLADFTPGGDDEIVTDIDGTIVGITSMGAGYVPPISGFIEKTMVAFDNTKYSNIYIRFFSAVDPLAEFNATNSIEWGESAVFSVPVPDSFSQGSIDFAPDEPLFINQLYAVPEPLSAVLMLVGLGALRFIRKK